jgi:hypothetical protein
MRAIRQTLWLTLAAILAALSAASSAPAAQLLGRNAGGVRLTVSNDGRAMVRYTSGGREFHVLAWGAVNAIAPSHTRTQVSFHVDYSGGWKSFHQRPAAFRGSCGTYKGPAIHWLVAACRAPDGSFWALQSWQRALPNYGVQSSATQRATELRLSHWRGALPVLELHVGWAQKRYHTLFGRFTYRGTGVYGFRSDAKGAPLDSFGRLLYVDTDGSRYGVGWQRENSFLTHRPGGTFCYGFFPHGAHPSGMGDRYRATMMSPGVLPDMYWEGVPPSAYDGAYDAAAREQLDALEDPSCGQV